MSRRTLAKVSLALIVVLVASLSTVRVRQAWGEQQAKSSSDAARHQVARSLARAQKLGLEPSEVAPFRQAATRLDSLRGPSSSLLWGSDETFYNRERAALKTLLVRLQRQVEHVRILTKMEALAANRDFGKIVVRARAYDVDAVAAIGTLARLQTRTDTAKTPGAFRAIARESRGTAARLRFATDQRARYVAGVLKSTGNTALGVVQQADVETASARGQLSLVSLFAARQALALGNTLTTANTVVHGQTSAFGAAVKEWRLHDLVSRAAGVFYKIVPAKLVVVSTVDQWAHMYENGNEVYNTAVTTGGPELPTDRGIFHIYMKASPFEFHSPWGPDSPYYYPPTPVNFWMPFDGAEGLHDASWRSNFGPGSNYAPTDLGTGNTILGTHGCVNMPYDAASFVWNWAPIGTTVVVT